jgi:hypothetical protein
MVDNPHFKELLQKFNANEVEYLVVGGYAVMKYTEPRFTKHLDLWASNSWENANASIAVWRNSALRSFKTG